MTVLERLQAKARARIPAGVLVESLPRRDRWLLYAAYPSRTARYFHRRFQSWTVLPGSVWEDFQRDMHFVVTSVKPNHLEAEAWSGRMWHDRHRFANAPRVKVDGTNGQFWCRQEHTTGAMVAVVTFDRDELKRMLPE